jgi:plasmid stabilization system protein ParE
MAYAVQILDLAKQDIIARIAYIRQRWGDAKADQAYLGLMDKLDLLATQPLMGGAVQQLANAGIMEFRILVHDQHTKILYELDEDKETIVVHMIYSSSQNFQTLLYNRIIRYL